MGVSIARANVQLRLRRLHYICPNKRAAALAAKRNACGNTWKTPGFSWFAEQEHYQYEEWHMFCNAFRPDRGC
eukprot:165127-Ditylum_brightwellii.AAC.1